MKSVLLAFLLLLAAPAFAQAPPPEVEIFEWLGNFEGISAAGRAINRHGDVAGLAYQPTWARGWFAFTYIGGVGQHYPTPTGHTGSAEAINDAGVAVGYMPHLRMSEWYPRATVFGGPTLFEGERSQARGINSDGVITGFIRQAGSSAVFRWHPDGSLEVLNDIGLPSWAEGLAINDAGQIAGYYSDDTPMAESRLFILEPDNSITYLPHITPEWPEPTAINEAGHVVGVTYSYEGVSDLGFHWDGKAYTFLPMLPGDAGYSAARDINNLGQIVGYSRDCAPKRHCDDGVLWQDGVLYKLEDLAADFLLPDDYIGRTYSITDNGWITGGGYNSATDKHEAYRMKLAEAPVAVEDAAAPAVFALHAAYPNPFANRATIAFDLPQPAPVRLVVYDVLGREVAVLVEGERTAGRHEVVFDGAGLPGGMYLVRLEAGAFAATQRVVLAR